MQVMQIMGSSFFTLFIIFTLYIFFCKGEICRFSPARHRFIRRPEGPIVPNAGETKNGGTNKAMSSFIIHINCKFFKGKKPLKAVARNIYTIAQKKASLEEMMGRPRKAAARKKAKIGGRKIPTAEKNI